jgi:hypothetical protein
MNEELNKALNNIGKELIAEISRQLVSLNKVASGNLLNSLDYKVIEVVDGLTLELVAADYLNIVDKGRRPGNMPPTKAIESWIKVRGINVGKKGIKSTAFAIATSIKHNGIKATNIKQNAINNILTRMQQLLQTAAIEDINKQINEILK